MVLRKPTWLKQAEEHLRPLDYLPRRTALALGGVVGAGAGAAAVWNGAPWAYAAGLGVLGVAGWLASSGEAVARVELVPEEDDEEGKIRAARAAIEAGRAPPPDPPTGKPSDALGMVLLPGGTFWMGSPESEDGHQQRELLHEETVGPFRIGRYVVRQLLYQAVVGSNPSEPSGGDLPVNNVSWFDAVRFCNALSRLEGFEEAYFIGEGDETEVRLISASEGYRLSTEAEWEYAARAGTRTAYSFGDDPKGIEEHAWWPENADGRPHDVATKKPNPWGLFDVHGNVWEWCWDVFGDYDKPRLSVGARVLRGGSFWNRDPGNLRSALRSRYRPEFRGDGIGFRCVRGGSRQQG